MPGDVVRPDHNCISRYGILYKVAPLLGRNDFISSTSLFRENSKYSNLQLFSNASIIRRLPSRIIYFCSLVL